MPPQARSAGRAARRWARRTRRRRGLPTQAAAEAPPAPLRPGACRTPRRSARVRRRAPREADPRSARGLGPPPLARCLEDAEEERREDHFDAEGEQAPAHDGEVGDGLVELAAVRTDPEPENPRVDAEADADGGGAHQQRQLEPISGEKPL